MKKIYFLLILFGFYSCNQKKAVEEREPFNQLAEKYVRLGLEIGKYDGDFVDAYYGPDTLKPDTIKLTVFPKDSFLVKIKNLQAGFETYIKDTANDTLSHRAKWISAQLTAFSRRVKIFSGEFQSFDEESKELFGVAAPSYPESYYKGLVANLDSFLPGKGDLATRFQGLANKFIIPKNKLDTVFKAAISESRKRTLEHFQLPATENFSLEYVTGKSWSGYNWYRGNFTSLIQLNTDTDIFIERAIDVASHESYPGHHVYNMLLEKNLYRDKGWVEISLYPLFSPQSLIAEGSANYGIEMAFPGEEKIAFAKNVLLPLAGIDTTGIAFYFRALEVKGKLNFARNEVGRGLINGTMNEEEAMRWLMQFGMSNEATAKKSISFIKKYRSYVINYNYGMQLVRNYIEKNAGNGPASKWESFGRLLSSEILSGDLIQ